MSCNCKSNNQYISSETSVKTYFIELFSLFSKIIFFLDIVASVLSQTIIKIKKLNCLYLSQLYLRK